MKTLADRPEGVPIPINGPPTRGPGFLAPIALSAGVGLLLCSVADALSRGTSSGAMGIYWLGILFIALPIFYRLTSRQASSNERLCLVLMLGLGLYLVKVFRDAPMFTFNDELIHAYNTHQIDVHKHLFHSNPILKVTPYYPGLEGATSALTQLTGLSSYVAGTVLVAAARLTLVGALFFLFKRVSGSARIAGLGTAIYAGNFNFLFYGAQYSYESLALPLLLVVLMLVAEREAAPREALRDWTLPIALGIVAIVVTHHLTSYATVFVLAALAIIHWLVWRSWRAPNPWPFAIFAAILAGLWLTIVAGSTFGYLSSPLSGAFDAIIHTVAGEAPPRGLFQGGSANVAVTPLGARGVSLLAVLLLTIGVPFGLSRIYQRYRDQPFAILFSLAALGFFVTLALRLAPAAWETGNRASEFFFIGLAFVLACAIGLGDWSKGGNRRFARLGLSAGLAVILIGGSISGWPWDTQLAQPLRVSAGGGRIVSQPLAVAEWARDQVPGGRFAAPTADANLLLVPGGKTVLTGTSPDVADILTDPNLAAWQLPLLRENDLRYVVVDRRKISNDAIRGYYFSRDDSSEAEPLLPVQVATKFEAVPGAARIYTNGTIAVYDLEAGR